MSHRVTGKYFTISSYHKVWHIQQTINYARLFLLFRSRCNEAIYQLIIKWIKKNQSRYSNTILRYWNYLLFIFQYYSNKILFNIWSLFFILINLTVYETSVLLFYWWFFKQFYVRALLGVLTLRWLDRLSRLVKLWPHMGHTKGFLDSSLLASSSDTLGDVFPSASDLTWLEGPMMNWEPSSLKSTCRTSLCKHKENECPHTEYQRLTLLRM